MDKQRPTKLLRVTLLGSPQLLLGNDSLIGRVSGKALALFLYLAVTGQPQQREHLAHLLWGELSEQQARNNLRYLLPELREILGDYLLITPKTIAFNRQAAYWLDVEGLRSALFTTGTKNNGTKNGAKPHSVQPQTLQAALDLYQGEFLARFHVRNAPAFEAWVEDQRRELRQLYIQGLQTLAHHYLQQGAIQKGLATTQQLLSQEPLHETGTRIQMKLLAANGQRNKAIERYQTLRQALEDQLGITPEAETEALYQQLRAGKVHLPCASSPPMPAHNLSTQLTPFIGRQDAVSAILTLLCDPAHRFVTLVGEGGSGKSRLALAVAQSLLEREDPHHPFPDGLWFVPLATVPTSDNLPDRMATAIAFAMRFTFQAKSPPQHQLFAYLRNKQALLLLDNFEHLLEAADLLYDLLQAAPRIKVLVTSRHMLNAQAAYHWRVEGLQVPSPAEAKSLAPDQLLRYDAIALFVERANHQIRGFSIRPENRDAVIRICRFVQGLPLGIELAAALTRLYTCHEIANALVQNYAILETTQRDLPDRHRTIQATLAYSWSFLNPEEARTLMQCAIFCGSFDRSAAEAVTGANRAILASLEDQSLLRKVSNDRYELHEMIRRYALNQLQQKPEGERSVHNRHCDYYTQFLSKQTEQIDNNLQSLHQIRSEIDNIRTAWQWATEQGRLDALEKSLHPLAQCYKWFALYQEADSLLANTLGALERMTEHFYSTPPSPATSLNYAEEIIPSPIVPSPLIPSPLRGRLGQDSFALKGNLLAKRANFNYFLGKLHDARNFAYQACQIGQALADRTIEGWGQLYLGAALREQGHSAACRACNQRALSLALQQGHLDLIMTARYAIALDYHLCGDYQHSLAFYQDALSIAQTTGDLWFQNLLAINLSMLYESLGEFDSAFQYAYQGLETSRALALPYLIAHAAKNLGDSMLVFGNFSQARAYCEQARQLFESNGNLSEQADVLRLLGEIAYQQGDQAQALDYFHQCLALPSGGATQALVNRSLGQLLTDGQAYAAALAHLQDALRYWQTHGNTSFALIDQALLARLFLVQDELSHAQQQAEAVLAALDGVAFDLSWGATLFLSLYRTFAAQQDPRASQVLQRGHDWLQTVIASLNDSSLRRSFLENVVANRELVGLAQQKLRAYL